MIQLTLTSTEYQVNASMGKRTVRGRSSASEEFQELSAKKKSFCSVKTYMISEIVPSPEHRKNKKLIKEDLK